MARNRILYNCLGLFKSVNSTGYNFTSGNSGVNLIRQMQRVQSVSDDWTINLADINQIGQLAAIDRVSFEPPTINLSYDYIVADVSNERKLGFDVSGTQPAIRLLLDKTEDDSNYFLAVAPQGTNIYEFAGNSQVFQFTNAYLTSYSVNGAIGSPITANVGCECLNWATSTGSSGVPIKAIDPTGGQVIQGINFTIPQGISGIATVSALRPEGITVDLNNAALGINTTGLNIQSFDLSLDLSRENLNKFGSFFAYSKDFAFPANFTMSFTAYVGDLVESNLRDQLCNNPDYNVTINVKDPVCVGDAPVAIKYIGKGMKLDSESFSDQGVGSTAAQVTISLSSQISNESARGFFISGTRF
jgi:hypothetical protein